MNKRIIGLSVCLMMSNAVATELPLAGVHTATGDSAVYMPTSLIERYLLTGAQLSEQRAHHDRREYVCGLSSDQLIEKMREQVLADELVQLALRDASVFLIPASVLKRAGVDAGDKQAVLADAHGMRSFLKFLLKCSDASTDQERALVVRGVLMHSYKRHQVRGLRRISWALEAASWFDDVCQEFDGSQTSDSDSASISSSDSDTVSGVSLISEEDDKGDRYLRTDIAWLVRTRDHVFLQERLHDGVLDLSDCGIASTHDLHLLADMLEPGQWETITKLNLSQNPLIDASGIAMPELQQLDISSCRLSCLPVDFLKNLPALKLLWVNHNELTQLPVVGRDSVLVGLEARNNHVATLPSNFVGSLPANIVIDLHHNPLWQVRHRTGLQEVLVEQGYEELSEEALRAGRVSANQVRDALFADTREKLFDYLFTHRLLTADVLKDEVCIKRPIGAIHTRAADVGMWFYRYGGWFVLGASILGGGIGAVVGYVLRQAATSVARRVLVGAGIGVVVGAIAGAVGYRVFYDPRNFYLSSGGSDVYMTSELRELYIGVYRLIALLYLLKQYLVACNSCLHWVLHYDQLMAQDDHLEHILSRIEEQLHLRADMLLARTDDAGCVAMISQLVAQNPVSELRRHCPDDLFPARDMRNQPLAQGATFTFLGIEKLTLVRGTICRFADAARTLRAMLMNRYIGSSDHCGILKMVTQTEQLKHSLRTVIDDVLAPTVTALEVAGHGHEEWGEELAHLEAVAKDTHRLLSTLEEQAAGVERMLR